MWASNEWIDYEVIDTAFGEKLERWGNFRFIRPDPQIIWPGSAKKEEWANVNARYQRSKKGGGEWEFIKGKLPEKYDIPKAAGSEIASLRKELQKAIETEDYETAALLRDRIRELQKGEDNI